MTKTKTPKQTRAFREKHELSQEEAAQLLRLNSSRAVRAYEDGSRKCKGPVTIVMDLVDALGKKKIISLLAKRCVDM